MGAAKHYNRIDINGMPTAHKTGLSWINMRSDLYIDIENVVNGETGVLAKQPLDIWHLQRRAELQKMSWCSESVIQDVMIPVKVSEGIGLQDIRKPSTTHNSRLWLIQSLHQNTHKYQGLKCNKPLHHHYAARLLKSPSVTFHLVLNSK